MPTVQKSLAPLFMAWLFMSPLWAGALPPLAACDTSSPRATLESFQRITAKVQSTLLDQQTLQAEKLIGKAIRCLNERDIPRERIDDEGEAGVILLQEILDRIEIPPYAEIPDAARVRDEELWRWMIPDTEIEIAIAKEGPREGEWLFSPETVAQLKDFYYDVESIPYRSDAVRGLQGPLGGAYSYYIQMPEPSMLTGWVEHFPDWSRGVYFEQPVWKWMGLVLVPAVALFVFLLVLRLNRRVLERQRDDKSGLGLSRVVAPLAGLFLVLLTEHLIDEVVNITGTPDAISEVSMWLLALFFIAWLIFAVGEIVAEVIIETRHVNESGIDASLISITVRLISFCVSLWVVLEGAEGVGLSLIPLVAGLGVGGLAVALAVRPTIENLIGGFILYIDRPVGIGDRCIFGTQEGFVEEVGLRSTRIRTLKQTLVSVPNAEFAHLQLENVSRREMTLYQTVLGLRYETTADQLRYVLARLRETLVGHPMVAPKRLRVRFLGFGDYSLNIEIFAYFRTKKFEEYWGLREDLNLRIIDLVKEAGTGFAFPSSTAYLGEDKGLDEERSRSAEAKVGDWRTAGDFPVEQFDEARLSSARDK